MAKKIAAKAAVEKIKPGRKTDYKTQYCDELIDHMSKGYSYESFAGSIGVVKKTLYNWEESFLEWGEAKEIAFEKCRLFWEKLGIDHVINTSDSFGEGQSSSRSLNSTVWIFNMKNRFKWRDKQPDEVDTVVNNITNLSIEELEKIVLEGASQIKKGKANV